MLLSKEARAKVADVGLASLESALAFQGGSGFVGTLAWAAPEVLLEGAATAKSDMFSVGVLLW